MNETTYHYLRMVARHPRGRVLARGRITGSGAGIERVLDSRELLEWSQQSLVAAGAGEIEIGTEFGRNQILEDLGMVGSGQLPQDATAVAVLVAVAQADDTDVGRKGRLLNEGAGEQRERVAMAAEDMETDELGPPTDARIDSGQGDQSTEVLWSPETVGQPEPTHAVLPDAVRAELRADLRQHRVGEPKETPTLRHPWMARDDEGKKRRKRDHGRDDERARRAESGAQKKNAARMKMGGGGWWEATREEENERRFAKMYLPEIISVSRTNRASQISQTGQ